MTTKRTLYRQGDVLLELVDSIPANADIPIKRDKRGVILAEGEVTGHAHRIPSRHASLYRTESDARYLRVTAPVPLTHEEHKTECATCRAEGKEVFATMRLAGAFGRDAYRCQDHAVSSATDVVSLVEPGATDLPPGNYRVTIHAEYQPGELPRQVAD